MAARFTWSLLTIAAIAVIAAVVPVALASPQKSTARAGKSSLPGNAAVGKTIFIEFCGKCHTLKAAGSNGTLGPNLDQDKVTFTTVVSAVEEGVGGIQAEYILRDISFAEVYDVAKFVATEREPGGTAGEENG